MKNNKSLLTVQVQGTLVMTRETWDEIAFYEGTTAIATEMSSEVHEKKHPKAKKATKKPKAKQKKNKPLHWKTIEKMKREGTWKGEK